MFSFNRKKFKFLGIFLVILIVIIVILVVCGNELKNFGDNKVINWYIFIEISILDILKNIDVYLNLVIGNLGSNLFRIDKEGKLKFDLVKKVFVFFDGFIYIVIFCDNLKWLDGSKLSVEDFVYIWWRIVDFKIVFEYVYLVIELYFLNVDKINFGDIKDLNKFGVIVKGN